jgi:phosphoribosylanthranilate isomerase
MIKVKICGIKRLEDALLAVSYGADALGFLLGQKHSSNDFLEKEDAKGIIEKLPPFVSSVLVTHLEKADEIVPLAKYLGVSTIQLHGDTSPEEAKTIKKELHYIKIYKAIHVINEGSIEKGKSYLPFVDAVLPDTINLETDQVGGTGKTHDWNISKKMVEYYDIPLILAGGLNPDNVIDSIKFVKPYAVDANSGTKGVDGYKDKEKLRLFIERAKTASY